ncbi:MAG TPA: alpha/beta hydrolase [Chloroflexota bacterium]|nr:alpha/beta hydrolase [Chloroflexota bacterium]
MRRQVGPYRIYSRDFTGPSPEAPAVVLVHGFIVSGRYMVPSARLLARWCRVFVPDLPGWGYSDKPARALTLPHLADALHCWSQEVGLDKPVYVANSFGCQIVTELAVRRPDAVSRLVLLGPTIDAYHRTLPEQGRRLAVDMTREPPSLWPLEVQGLAQMGVPRALETLRVMMNDRIECRLPHIRQPVLVARGSQDVIVPLQWAEEVAELLPDSRLAVIPDAPHAANFSAPARFVKTILRFVS